MKKFAALAFVAATGLSLTACAKHDETNVTTTNEVVTNDEGASDFNADAPAVTNDVEPSGNLTNTN